MSEEEHYVSCIGKDNKWHVFLPWENKTKCGQEILIKKPKEKDHETTHFSCYECTF